jgi:S-adenosyl-L-methionine hydrolase (adenosine-forming)
LRGDFLIPDWLNVLLDSLHLRIDNTLMPIVTITTDFGNKDGFVGTMRGVIWNICPEAQIADITNDVPPQDVMTGAITLWRTAPFFPADTIHLAVVDPGVGTARRPMAAKFGGQYFVGPDNGLFTPLILDCERVGGEMLFIHLDRPEYWLENASHTFHGRDIFAPIAAHLAAGVPLMKLGAPFADPVRLSMPSAEHTSNGWTAHIMVIDIFGNLTTDLPASALKDRGVCIKVKGQQINGLIQSYGHRKPGELVALVDSEGFVEVAVVNGSAAKMLDMKLGEPVEITYV